MSYKYRDENILENKLIILLIGQKGSGKSFIGSLLESEFGIKFIRVEDRVKEVKRNRNIDDDTYLYDAFKTIENDVKQEAGYYEKIWPRTRRPPSPGWSRTAIPTRT